MTVTNSGIRVGDGSRKMFNIHSNLTDNFEIGEKANNDIWLHGKVIDGDFVFNGRLYLKSGQSGTLIDNFPKGDTPDGWSQRRRLDVEGYELLDERGECIFAYRVEGNVCFVDVSLYNAAGALVATSGQGGLVIDGISFRM